MFRHFLHIAAAAWIAMLIGSHSAAQEVGPKVAFVFSNRTTKAVKPETVVARIDEAFGVKPTLLDRKSQADVETLRTYDMVVSDAELVGPSAFEALGTFVTGGGYLVATGWFGRWLDVDGDGALDPKVDKLAPNASRRLTGCDIRNDGLAVLKMRVLTRNPVFRDFHVNEWIPYPVQVGSSCSLAIGDEALALAEARYQPAGAGRPGFTYSYLAPRLSARYDCHVAARKLGQGVVLRVGESLFRIEPKGMFEAFWRNVLEPETFRGLIAALDTPDERSPTYEHKSLLPNPDFEEVCPTKTDKASGGNRVKGTFLMPAGWYFNSWRYDHYARIEKCANAFGDHVLLQSADDPAAAGAGANWVLFHDLVNLRPGRTYRLTVLAKAEGITRGGAGVQVRRRNGEWVRFDLAFPAGSFEWRTFEKNFTVPMDAAGDKAFRRGVLARVGFVGPGKLYADHFVLEEIEN